MNRYNRTGYVRVRTRHGRAQVMTLRPYLGNTLTHQRNRFKTVAIIAHRYRVHAHKLISHLMQNNGPSFFQHDNARPHTTRK